jgi:hypothetical protein
MVVVPYPEDKTARAGTMSMARIVSVGDGLGRAHVLIRICTAAATTPPPSFRAESRNLPERSGSPLGTVALSVPGPLVGERSLGELGMTI